MTSEQIISEIECRLDPPSCVLDPSGEFAAEWQMKDCFGFPLITVDEETFRVRWFASWGEPMKSLFWETSYKEFCRINSEISATIA